MKKSIQRIVRTVIAATLSLAIMGAGSSAFAAESAFSQWKTDDWTEAAENGTPILKSQPGKSINVLYLKGKAAGNKLSFDIRVDNHQYLIHISEPTETVLDLVCRRLLEIKKVK